MTEETKRGFQFIANDEWDSWSLQSVAVAVLESFQRDAGALLSPDAAKALAAFVRECDEFKCEDTP